jgi:hypothetical protein
MATIPGGFNAANHEPDMGRPAPLPTGWYTVMITESEMKATKAGTGQYLELTMKVMDGEHNGRLIWDRLNIDNPNPVAVEIANKTLAAICHATNVFELNDSAQLHGIPLQARVVVREASGGYDASNDINGDKAAEGGDTQVAASAPTFTPPAAAPAPAPAAGGTPPWAT